MHPYLHVFGLEIGTFHVFVFLASCAMLGAALLMNKGHEKFLLPKILVSGVAAFFGSAIYDSLFKIAERGAFTLDGMAFYGGLIGSAAMFWLLVRNDKRSPFSPLEWLNRMVIPFCTFCVFGRLGCFFGGCCYGMESDSFLALHFPDNPAKGVLHYGNACLPTQLFECIGVAILILLFVFVIKKERFMWYMTLYPALRFVLEFFRGDDRGSFFGILSPAQFTSVILILIPTVYFIKNNVKKRQTNE